MYTFFLLKKDTVISEDKSSGKMFSFCLWGLVIVQWVREKVYTLPHNTHPQLRAKQDENERLDKILELARVGYDVNTLL